MAINIRVQEIVTIVAIAAALGIAYAVSSLYPVSLSDAVQGAIVGGIIGFGSSIGVNLILAYIRRQILSISEQTTEWDVDLYPEYMEDQGELRPSYWSAARIIVENQGRTAAKDCKASIIVNGIGTRVAWMIPKDDFTVTINAYDTELIDLCAIHPKEGLLFTTEHGYKKDAMGQYGRIVGQLKVSASNAEQSVRDIWISPTKDSGGKFVYFSKPEGFE